MELCLQRGQDTAWWGGLARQVGPSHLRAGSAACGTRLPLDFVLENFSLTVSPPSPGVGGGQLCWVEARPIHKVVVPPQLEAVSGCINRGAANQCFSPLPPSQINF